MKQKTKTLKIKIPNDLHQALSYICRIDKKTMEEQIISCLYAVYMVQSSMYDIEMGYDKE